MSVSELRKKFHLSLTTPIKQLVASQPLPTRESGIDIAKLTLERAIIKGAAARLVG
jgi:hypothetical protein